MTKDWDNFWKEKTDQKNTNDISIAMQKLSIKKKVRFQINSEKTVSKSSTHE